MDIILMEILIWVGIVLAAGFVVFLGRYLVMLIIKRTPGRQPPQTRTREAAKKILTSMDKKVAKSHRQSQKKLAKIAAKRDRKEKKK